VSKRANFNSLPIPFESGCANQCRELLRVWVTEENKVAYSANFDSPGLDDVAILGVALVSLAEDIALEAARNHGLDPNEFLNEMARELEVHLNAKG
jgi:hypothetical protein